MNTAPTPVFRVSGKQIAFPTDPVLLPGLSPAAVREVLTIIERHAIDPKTVDLVKAQSQGARFAIEVSTYGVAETLRRLDGGTSLAPYLAAIENDSDFESVAEAFAIVVKRNPKVFGATDKAAPAELPAGN